MDERESFVHPDGPEASAYSFRRHWLKGDRRDENQSVGSVKFLSLSMYSNGVT